MILARHNSGTLFITVLLLGLTGCKADKTTPCGDQTCRDGFSCDTIHDVCVVPAQLEVCVGEADGSECRINGLDGFVCDQQVCLQSECGDGILDVHTGEECDDGNHVDDDECPNNCTLNCGNGTVNPGEQCDGNDLHAETCTTRGFDSGQLTCELNCTFDESQCAVECGNGVVHNTEGCDDDNNTAGDGCSATCEVEAGWQCEGSPSACEPIPYTSLTNGGGHACAIRADDTVWCWGLNANGQLGDGGTSNSSVPVQVNLPGTVAISAGVWHTCAIISDGTVWCWGLNNVGQLGNGTTTDINTPNALPAQVPDLTGAVALETGGAHTCVTRSDDTLWCWGSNELGQLGDGTSTNRTAPVEISGFTGFLDLSLGLAHTCAIKYDSTVWCWGQNFHGQLGVLPVTGEFEANPNPVQVFNVSGAVALSAGGAHTCALTSGEAVYCWGWNNQGQSGGSGDPKIQALVSGLSGIDAVVTGIGHTCAKLTAGTARCFGWNLFGQLGDNTAVPSSSSPTWVDGLTDVDVISSRADFTCVLRTNGRAWCWGKNEFGQLGNEATLDSNVPVEVVIP
jgi:cysteine-rich repeat protein